MAQQVFPTKSNLMATKRSLALAEQGYDLMDRKRNILVREMMLGGGVRRRRARRIRLAAEHPQRHGRGTAPPLAADDLAFGHLL